MSTTATIDGVPVDSCVVTSLMRWCAVIAREEDVNSTMKRSMVIDVSTLLGKEMSILGYDAVAYDVPKGALCVYQLTAIRQQGRLCPIRHVSVQAFSSLLC